MAQRCLHRDAPHALEDFEALDGAAVEILREYVRWHQKVPSERVSLPLHLGVSRPRRELLTVNVAVQNQMTKFVRKVEPVTHSCAMISIQHRVRAAVHWRLRKG